MRKFYSILIALLAVCGMAQAQVVFDFSGDDAYTLFGFTGFSSSSASDGDFNEDGTLTSGDVTITVSPSGKSNPNRMWSGSLRLYGGTLTIASSGKHITSVKFNLNNSKWGSDNSANVGTLETGLWTGDAAETVISISANTQIKSMEVYLDGSAPDPVDPTPSIDWTSSATAPLTVAAALAKAGQLAGGEDSGKDVYVKGLISEISEIGTVDKNGNPYGNATYTIVDAAGDENGLVVFRGVGLNGAKLAEDDIKVGDEVVVVGVIKNYVDKDGNSTLEFNSGSKLYSLNGVTEGGETPNPEAREFSKIADMQQAASSLGTEKLSAKYSFSNAIVIGVKGKNIYITDGERGLLLYGDNSKELKLNDVISGSITGELQLYNGVTELGSANFDGISFSANTIVATPVKATIADITNDATKLTYESMLVTIKDLSIVVVGTEVKAIDDSDNEIVLYDNYGIGLAGLEFKVENTYDVTAIVGNYKGTIQLYPRLKEDIDGEFGEEIPFERHGDGTWEKPYSVEDLLSFDIPSKNDTIQKAAWVEGYIIGTVKNNKLAPGVEEAAATNIALASTADEQTVFIPVELPKGDVRTALNLADNPEMIGKHIWLCGTITQYFSMNGLKQVSEYRLEGNDGVADLNAAAATQAIYNLAGQRLQTINRSGLYIVGGKKVVVK